MSNIIISFMKNKKGRKRERISLSHHSKHHLSTNHEAVHCKWRENVQIRYNPFTGGYTKHPTEKDTRYG